MSYSINSPCWNCAKRVICTDEKKIQDGINRIHETSFEDGHQGSGIIVLACTQQHSQGR